MNMHRAAAGPAARSLLAALTAAVLALAACGAGGTPTPGPSTGQSANPSTPAFQLMVTPPQEPPEARAVIPGEHTNFLVRIDGVPAGSGPYNISATAVGASVLTIWPSDSLTAGKLAEVWLDINPGSVEAEATVDITASISGQQRTEHRTLKVMPLSDDRLELARPYFDYWTGWLASEHPELGITASTSWEPEYVSTFLVVSHYAYYSEKWELQVAWHNMIPPSDFTEITLRHREDEVVPVLAWRVESWSGHTDPHPIPPPEVVMR